jgi:hypothetical protein
VNDAWGYTDETTQQELNNGPKPLRDAYEAQKKANDDLMKRLAALEAINQKNQAADLIEAQGVPRSVAKYYNGEPDAEKVTAFVNDLRTAFGGAPAVSADNTNTATTVDQAQYQKMNEAGTNGTLAGSMEIAKSNLENANSRAELMAALAQARG